MTVYYLTKIEKYASRSELNEIVIPALEQLTRLLSLLDSGDHRALALWRGPDGVDFWDVDMTIYPMTFLQAGGTRDGMAIEWKTNRDGEFRQYAVGHPGSNPGKDATQPDHEIRLGENRIFAYEHEVFSYEEAADIFHHYFLHDSPPATYELRDLQLGFGPDGKVRGS
ncbi:hypothetical protein [Leucobacter chromiiresistens]|uniref:Uncharacterized protein n=1 Tax=Leucobacter chromiiresistens TaxID=1079994 RepID=A0A1H1A748_9MICO|nr:hypothetical protein [Leucobacter chromiiresistens]SDQ35487.1 hypothetical protein SAMN04488565_2393 [Leucobacter chromiiresistens]